MTTTVVYAVQVSYNYDEAGGYGDFVGVFLTRSEATYCHKKVKEYIETSKQRFGKPDVIKIVTIPIGLNKNGPYSAPYGDFTLD